VGGWRALHNSGFFVGATVTGALEYGVIVFMTSQSTYHTTTYLAHLDLIFLPGLFLVFRALFCFCAFYI
jgi:hypothetical protein